MFTRLMTGFAQVVRPSGMRVEAPRRAQRRVAIGGGFEGLEGRLLLSGIAMDGTPAPGPVEVGAAFGAGPGLTITEDGHDNIELWDVVQPGEPVGD